jgi:hypothetical protein
MKVALLITSLGGAFALGFCLGAAYEWLGHTDDPLMWNPR